MIKIGVHTLTQSDIGSRVIYNAGHSGAADEEGWINSFRDNAVYVRFGHGSTGQRCNPERLRFANYRQEYNDPNPPKYFDGQ